MLAVPIIQQITPYSCGSACIYALLRYWLGDAAGAARESDLWDALEIDQESGVEPENLVDLARMRGLHAEITKNAITNDLRRLLDEGATAILLLQAHRNDADVDWPDRWDDAHYVVCVGADSDRFVFMDPSTHTSYVWLSSEDLSRRWHSLDADGNEERGVCVIVRGDLSSAAKAYPAEMRHLG